MVVKAVIPAAGSGTRLGGERKQFRALGHAPVWLWSVRAILSDGRVDAVVLVVPPQDVAGVREEVQQVTVDRPIQVVAGGERRQDSVHRGVEACGDETSLVLIHDAVRPFVSPKAVRSVLDGAREEGAAALALPITDTVRRVSQGWAAETLNREELVAMQTPQVFSRSELLAAFAAWGDETFTDEVALYVRSGRRVKLIAGETSNIKITRQEDWDNATHESSVSGGQVLGGSRDVAADMRVGMGYDVHRLVAGRPLVLAGMVLAAEKGLDGHSDADVLTHAICDALLGAIADDDIGAHFPNTDMRYKGAASLDLLAAVVERVHEQGFAVVNVDAMMMLEAPKLRAHVPSMRANLAKVLHVNVSAVSIKATTGERVGFVGRQEGAEAMATVLLQRARG